MLRKCIADYQVVNDAAANSDNNDPVTTTDPDAPEAQPVVAAPPGDETPNAIFGSAVFIGRFRLRCRWWIE